MKIAKVSGISGYNVGDKLITYCTSELLKRAGFEVIEIAINPSQMAKSLNVGRSESSHRKSFFTQIKFILFYRLNFVIYLYQLIRAVLKDLPLFKKMTAGTQYLIIGGGNLLFNKNGSNYLFSSLMLSRYFKQKVIFWGVGVGPFGYPYQRQLNELGKNSDMIYVRDSLSATYFSDSTNVRVSVDPAFVVSDLIDVSNSGVYKYIGVNIMDLILASPKFAELQCIRSTAENLIELSRRFGMTLLFVITSKADVVITKKVTETISDISPDTLFEILSFDISRHSSEKVALTKFFVCHRMHSSIISLSYNRKTLIFPWQQKITGMLNDMFGWSANSYSLKSPNFDFSEVVDLLERQDQMQLSAAVDEAKKKVYSDFAAIKDRLEVLQKSSPL